MNKFEKFFRAILDKNMRVNVLGYRGFYKSMPDDEYLERVYKSYFGCDLNLENPCTYNEKLQWLKLHNRKPEYTMMVDKYKVREFIKEQLGEEYLIPLLGVWDDPDDIDFDALPNQFVLKCNHNSGLGMCICKDKSKLNIPRVKAKLRKGLAQNYYLARREWPYKDVPRKIICEEYMTGFKTHKDDCEQDLVDYKFYCFDGTVKLVMVVNEGYSRKKARFDYFDKEYHHLPPVLGGPVPEIPPEKPERFERMLEIAELLSAGIPHVRVDLYLVKNQIYFGELTFFDGAGFEKPLSYEWASTLGQWIKLPIENYQASNSTQ